MSTNKVSNKLQSNKQDIVGMSTTVHNLLFCHKTLCMNCVTETFLLVCCLDRNKQLLSFVHDQGQKM